VVLTAAGPWLINSGEIRGSGCGFAALPNIRGEDITRPDRLSWKQLEGSDRAAMKILILGDGDEELGWARWLLEHSEHRLDAAFPGFSDPDLAFLPAPTDTEDALARPGLDGVIVGGPIELRGEYLRRAAAEGLAIICLHPSGEDSEAYYQVSLSRAETGAIIVPDLPLRLHPGVAALRAALVSGELGAFRSIRLEAPSPDLDADLARFAFARLVDVVRAMLGEIEAVTATGDPPGEHPDLELVVQLRAAEGRRAELRIRAGDVEPAELTLQGASGSLTLEFDSLLQQPAHLVRRSAAHPDDRRELPPWDPYEAIVSVLEASSPQQSDAALPRPNLLDATRAMELAEATSRSLRRGRTVDLYYETISEEANFKSVMTSTGCMILLAALFILPLALAGPSLGLGWTLFIPYVILPVLVIFVVAQVLRLAVRTQKQPEPKSAKAVGADETPLG
jgi:predicted dehydrogenase